LAYFDHFAGGKSTGIGDWLTARAIELQFAFLSRHLPHGRSVDILEIGPGHGEFAARIMSAGLGNYDVVEPNATLRAKLNALGVRHAKSYLIPDLEEADESYDAIIMCDVFEHLNDSREAHRFVSEAKRVLRKGGILFILSPDVMDWKEDFYNCDFSHSNPTTTISRFYRPRPKDGGFFERCSGVSTDMKQVFAGKHCQPPAGQSILRSI